MFPQGSLGSWGRKDKKKSMTNKQKKISKRAIQGGARDKLCKNALGMGAEQG